MTSPPETKLEKMLRYATRHHNVMKRKSWQGLYIDRCLNLFYATDYYQFEHYIGKFSRTLRKYEELGKRIPI